MSYEYDYEGTNQDLGHETRTWTQFVALKYKMALIHLLERFHLHNLPYGFARNILSKNLMFTSLQYSH